MGLLDKHKSYSQAYGAIRDMGADPFNVRFETVLSPTEGVVNGRPTILLGTNNYLGLTFDESCIEASVNAARNLGTGTTGSRIANGSFGGHVELEQAIARFYGRRTAMTFTTGYQANLGILSTLVGRGDHLLLDADSHASLYDGARLGHAEIIRFRHNDPDDLRKRLQRLKGAPGNRLIVTEGIFSMVGDTAPLKEIVEVKREMDAYLMVDEAHSLGVLGDKGRGLAEAEGVEADVDVITGTFSKSLGAIGGFLVSDMDDFEVMRVVCRPYMFTASLPPSVVASTLQALKRVEEEPGLRDRLNANAQRLYNGLTKLGFELGPRCSPIIAVAIPDQPRAIAVWKALLNQGVYLNLALPPATPDARPLLRSSISVAHTDDQIDQVLRAFKSVGETFGLLGEASRQRASA